MIKILKSTYKVLHYSITMRYIIECKKSYTFPTFAF